MNRPVDHGRTTARFEEGVELVELVAAYAGEWLAKAAREFLGRPSDMTRDRLRLALEIWDAHWSLVAAIRKTDAPIEGGFHEVDGRLLRDAASMLPELVVLAAEEADAEPTPTAAQNLNAAMRAFEAVEALADSVDGPSALRRRVLEHRSALADAAEILQRAVVSAVAANDSEPSEENHRILGHASRASMSLHRLNRVLAAKAGFGYDSEDDEETMNANEDGTTEPKEEEEGD